LVNISQFLLSVFFAEVQISRTPSAIQLAIAPPHFHLSFIVFAREDRIGKNRRNSTMVVDCAFLIGTATSFLLNGACCAYQLSREEELKVNLREELRKEWLQQRRREIQRRQKQQESHESDFEERYRRLLLREDGLSYTQTHFRLPRISGSATSSGRQDPPSSSISTTTSGGVIGTDATQLYRSRSSSLLDEREDGDEAEDDEDDLIFVTDSDEILEDISLSAS
jgi:hypothetical protein